MAYVHTSIPLDDHIRPKCYMHIICKCIVRCKSVVSMYEIRLVVWTLLLPPSFDLQAKKVLLLLICAPKKEEICLSEIGL